MNGRHRITRRHRRGLSLLATGTLVAGLGAVVTTTTATPAQAADPCLTPIVRDVMVTQGLPTYGSLVRGKTALVKYFLSEPTCAPADAVIKITGGTITSSLAPNVPLALTASTPLPPVGPATTAPVPSAESDPLFTIPGALLRSLESGRVPVTFKAELQFTATVGSTVQQDRLIVERRPDGTLVSAPLERLSNSIRVLAVPFINGGTELAPTVANTQFPEAEKSKLSAAFSAVARHLPVPDLVTDLRSQTGGFRYALSGGSFDIGPYLVNGRYCATGTEYTLQQKAMQLIRTNWNSANPAGSADLAYGVIPEGLSRGPGTGNGESCYDGQAGVGGIGSVAAYGRLISANRDGKSSAGSIAVMEMLHNFGSVKSGDVRSDGAFHSKNLQADGGFDNAWNLSSRTRIPLDKSALQYGLTAWDDQTTLLEKGEFDFALCRLTPAYSTSVCPDPGTLGRASAATGSGSFFVSGSTNNTEAGTDAHTYIDDNQGGEAPSPGSEYRFVQRDAGGVILSNVGIAVSFTDEGHAASGTVVATRSVGTFGTQVPAEAATTQLELWKGAPGAADSVRLHFRQRDAQPELVAISAGGRTVSVSATDDLPANLRLDMFVQCPSGTHPIVNFLKPTTVVGSVAVFSTRYDTSLACPQGKLLYRLSDGYLIDEQADVADQVVASALGTAAIHTPSVDASITAARVITFTGEGRDAAGRTADNLTWKVTGPSYPTGKTIGTGQIAELVPEVGLAAGTYTTSLEARDSSGLLLATAVRSFTVLADLDRDGMADAFESQPCFPAGAAQDSGNAPLDYDFDGLPNVDDPAPCTSTSNVLVSFTPTSLNTGSQGNYIKARLTQSQVDLRTIHAADLGIIQVAGYRVFFPASTLVADDATSGTAVFDRTALNKFLIANGITGDAPLYVGVTSLGLKGGDQSAPHIFPV